MSPARVLFVSHSGGRTGAPRVIFHAATWGRDRCPDTRLGFLFRKPGGVVSEFAPLGETMVVRHPPARWPFDQLIGRALLLAQALQLRRHLGPVDVIWSNTLANGELLPTLRRVFPHAPVITHAHELSAGTRLYTDADQLEHTLRLSDGYLAASHATAAFLRDELGIDPERIRVGHEFVPVDDIQARAARQNGDDDADLRAIRSHDGPLLVGCGSVEWRKGTDLFIEVGRLLAERHPDLGARLVWVGGHPTDVDAANQQVDDQGLSGTVTFLGERADATAALAAADALLLTSREDCFPLVMLEAAALRVPTVAFADTGGAAEFVEGGHGVLVPHLDTEAMADQAARLVGDAEVLAATGAAAERRVRAMADTSVGAPHAWEAVFELADQARARRR